MIPQRFPFRLLATTESKGESSLIRITGDGWWSRGGAVPSFLAVEMVAQASIVLLASELPGGFEGRSVLLAGVREARFHEPLRPGDTLRARSTIESRFGRILKVAGSLERDGAPVFEGSLLLAWEE